MHHIKNAPHTPFVIPTERLLPITNFLHMITSTIPLAQKKILILHMLYKALLIFSTLKSSICSFSNIIKLSCKPRYTLYYYPSACIIHKTSHMLIKSQTNISPTTARIFVDIAQRVSRWGKSGIGLELISVPKKRFNRYKIYDVDPFRFATRTNSCIQEMNVSFCFSQKCSKKFLFMM